MENEPLFLHIHLPKTAGTSLNSLLRAWFGNGFVEWYDTDPNRIYSFEEIERKVANTPTARCIASHSIRSYPRLVAGRQARYITFLREPLDRMISDCTYTRKHYETFSAQHKSALPREFADASVTGMLNYWLQRAKSLKASGTLVGDPICHFYSAIFIDRHRRALSRLQHLRGLAALGRWLIVRETMAILSSFFFVGITSEFARDDARLAQKLRGFGVRTDGQAAPVLNQSCELRAGWNVDEARGILRGLESFCRADELIYRNFSSQAVLWSHEAR